jgi:hypothetical protein
MEHAHNFKDIAGQRFGYLTAIEPAESIGSFNKSQNRMMYQAAWKFRCDCGNVVIKRRQGLEKLQRRGWSVSCGCKAFKDNVGNKHGLWKGVGELPMTYYSRLKIGAKKGSHRRRDLEFSVSIEYLWELFLKQNRRCVFTGELLEFGPRKGTVWGEQKKTTASLDRIDSSKGYVEGNVQWVHKDINLLKSNLSDAEFVDLCKKVAAYRS